MLQTKTAEEILSTVFKPKEFIIDGLLTQGLYVLAGAQKVGKSWLAMDICLSIATGVLVLGRETIQGSLQARALPQGGEDCLPWA